MKLRERAISLLARREHSQLELTQKLIVKGYSRVEVETELASLAREGLQSDERYTEAYVRQRIQSGFGPRRIIAELQQRGISDSLIQRHVPQDEQFWWETLSQLWQRKYDSEVLDEQAYARRARFLMQRGFDVAQVYRWMQKCQNT